jgi:hypothetical protein
MNLISCCRKKRTHFFPNNLSKIVEDDSEGLPLLVVLPTFLVTRAGFTTPLVVVLARLVTRAGLTTPRGLEGLLF